MYMRLCFWIWCLLMCSILSPLLSGAQAYLSCSPETSEVRAFFKLQNKLLGERRRQRYLAEYEYNTNVTEPNRQAMMAAALVDAEAKKELARTIRTAGYDQLCDPCVRRQAKLLADLGFNILNQSDYSQVQNAISSMQTNYATVKMCAYNDASDCTLTLEPHVQERLANSRNPKELEHYWRQWYDKAGTPMRENFATYVRLTRKAAKLNNFNSNAEYWLKFYEDPDFEQNLDAIYNAILPFYRELHGYVRYRLRQHYGDDVVSADGNIPMHLLGNIFAQQWHETIDLYTPFPEKPFVDVTAELERQQITVRKLFEMGDNFFKSLNMRGLPESFWKLSVLEKPKDRTIVCHASAWDLYKDSDVRVKMCTEVNQHYLYVVHHELGHIQYYLQYEDQPTVFRNSPNPGFHEAVGDVIGLNVVTPKHLKAIGLSTTGRLDERSRINELFKMALQKVVFLPFAYALDKYRYAVFRDEIDKDKWNCAFWQMRSEYTGVEPPVKRTDNDFDPTAKYHVDADVEYLRYFAAHIFQFQFQKALCIKAGQYVPGDPNLTLDNCDIYNSKQAGKAFSKLLSQGNSKHWKEVLQEFTGETAMDPAALLEYFEPLRRWLSAENRRLNVPLGWNDTNKVADNCCPSFST